ncbi:solute carrier family 25 (mitochondrial phosphate transporter), member 23/24/25/41 [Tremella mesenterica]|uniref:Solute carrier family 25 (Mitochondrial phosphate transporter), member 23/24/25/41 n=1 Tax=Tremella mesenterica TaxID=5217 RepID=A0A4Q1BHE5_TREME|nr:solute carrier family 25 (mitochondrial phosphate transporter), member 23/24/25/41 [Tremella mesenterica]
MTNPSSPSSSSSSSKSPFYSLQPHSEHIDPTLQPSPLEPPDPPPPSLREPPGPDLLPSPRPTLAQFRASEGPEARAAKLRALWTSLPNLPQLTDGPSALQRMKLPGQDTRTALSPQRAERLKKLYEEELVRRVRENRPNALLWGGADDIKPEPDNEIYHENSQTQTQTHSLTKFGIGIGNGSGSGSGSKGKGISWEGFRRFLWDQEKELWDIFQELDKNGDGRLDAHEMRAALSRSGIDITQTTVDDLVRFLASGSGVHYHSKGIDNVSSGQYQSKRFENGKKGKDGRNSPTVVNGVNGGPGGSTVHTPEDMYITFAEFRDFLIMLPRKATPFEIYKYYQVKKRYSDGRGAARVDKEGDMSVSFPKPQAESLGAASATLFGHPKKDENSEGLEDEVEEDFGDAEVQEDRHEAWRFLLAGGVAGAVSRTVTAPFDRLKIYLITTDHQYVNLRAVSASALRHPLAVGSTAVNNLWGAVTRIYVDGGGIKAFWVGNGLNVLKIFPESAIKFVSYEQSKKFLAQYWDKVSDASELSSSSRFLAGGVGGITSQFAIYGLETLKTRVQSEMGPAQGWRAVLRTAGDMWRIGGVRAYYRGLTLGLVGVFPYSAIDMGTYETLKKAYVKSTGKEEPSVFATLSFGALSGSIGAASVYPINLLRTRLQAAGSTGHKHSYTGFRDVLRQTLAHEGWRGLYKGLLPSILKVGPAVGVSWIVYEDAKRRLGV